ncbi:MAG TPA: ABC transporter substrate-binding protein [Candidatus Binatia bacterium]|jgi:NitT/TauT family transport system substrate-binding protein
MTKQFLRLALPAFSIVASLCGARPAEAQQVAKLSIGLPARTIASMQLFIAQDRGFFREEGLDVQLNQVGGNAAVAALLSGELFAFDSVGTSARAFRQGAPIKVLAVNLQSPLFWLVVRPELKSFQDLKGKVMGTTSFGGVQHIAGMRMLKRGGLGDKDVTIILAGDTPAQFQSLLSGAIQIAVLSPPTVILARDKFKMNILASAVDEFPSFFQSGLAVTEKSLAEQRELVKRVLRARAKANRYFFDNEAGSSEVIAKHMNAEPPSALESYRISRSAFSATGIATEKQVEEFLKLDAEMLKVPDPLKGLPAFDFSLQREVNQELGIK